VRERLEMCYWAILVGISFVVAGYHQVNHKPPPEVRLPDVQPVRTLDHRRTQHLCFFVGVPGYSSRACRAFGGRKRVEWEAICVPDPNCTKQADGSDYLEP
jgi:hypothetical protein